MIDYIIIDAKKIGEITASVIIAIWLVAFAVLVAKHLWDLWKDVPAKPKTYDEMTSAIYSAPRGLVNGLVGDFLTTKEPPISIEGLKEIHDKRLNNLCERTDSVERRMGSTERDGNSYHARLNALEANWRALSKEIQEISARLPPAPTPGRILRREDPDPAAVHPVPCEGCGNDMVIRRSHENRRTFWGCASYPMCKNTRQAIRIGNGAPILLMPGETAQHVCDGACNRGIVRRKKASDGSLFGVCDACGQIVHLL